MRPGATRGGAVLDRRIVCLHRDVVGDDVTYSMWGLGINQTIDAAAMELYAGYRNHSLTDGSISAVGGVHDISVFSAGARINF